MDKKCRYILWYNRSDSDAIRKNSNFAPMNANEQINEQLGMGYSARSLSPAILVGDATRISINRLHFIMVTDGEGVVDVDGHEYSVKAGAFIYVVPHHLLMLSSCSDNFKTAYACFSFDVLSDFPLMLKAELSDYVGNNPCLDLSDTDYAVLRKYYDLLINRYQSEDTGMEIIKGLLFSFVMEVNRIYSGRNYRMQVTHQDKLTDGFFKLLHMHFIKEHSAVFYAQKLCVSDKHLMRVIKKKTGQTFHFWITDFLLRQAKLLLLSTDMNVMQISESLNFPDSSGFAKFFRKGVGMSPLEYRGRHTEL